METISLKYEKNAERTSEITVAFIHHRLRFFFEFFFFLSSFLFFEAVFESVSLSECSQMTSVAFDFDFEIALSTLTLTIDESVAATVEF